MYVSVVKVIYELNTHRNIRVSNRRSMCTMKRCREYLVKSDACEVIKIIDGL